MFPGNQLAPRLREAFQVCSWVLSTYRTTSRITNETLERYIPPVNSLKCACIRINTRYTASQIITYQTVIMCIVDLICIPLMSTFRFK
jgi:hypothetical protein